MTDPMSRRAFAAYALGALSLALPAAAFAADPATGQATGKRAHKPARLRTYYRKANTSKKKINTGVCIPGEPDFDPDQCYDDIKD